MIPIFGLQIAQYSKWNIMVYLDTHRYIKKKHGKDKAIGQFHISCMLALGFSPVYYLLEMLCRIKLKSIWFDVSDEHGSIYIQCANNKWKKVTRNASRISRQCIRSRYVQIDAIYSRLFVNGNYSWNREVIWYW